MKEKLVSGITKLARIAGYAVVEVLTAQAFAVFLEGQISNEVNYGLAIVIVYAVAKAIKELLGEDNSIAKIL